MLLARMRLFDLENEMARDVLNEAFLSVLLLPALLIVLLVVLVGSVGGARGAGDAAGADDEDHDTHALLLLQMM